MNNRNKISVGKLWHAVNPLILYYMVSLAVSTTVMQKLLLQAGFAVMDSSIGEDGMLDYVFRQYQVQTMDVILMTAAVSVPLFGWMYYRDLVKRENFDIHNFQIVLEVRTVVLAIFGSASLALFCNNLISLSPLIQWSESYEEVNEALYAGGIWKELLGAGIGAAVSEELLMRGLLFERLRDLMQPKAAIFWSALIFAVFHGNIVQGVYAFLMGMFFAWLKERFHTILIPIAAHMSANMFIVLLAENEGLSAALGTYAGFAVATVLCGSCFLAVFRILKRDEN